MLAAPSFLDILDADQWTLPPNYCAGLAFHAGLASNMLRGSEGAFWSAGTRRARRREAGALSCHGGVGPALMACRTAASPRDVAADKTIRRSSYPMCPLKRPARAVGDRASARRYGIYAVAWRCFEGTRFSRGPRLQISGVTMFFLAPGAEA